MRFRIAFSGAHSTGKTTLLGAVSQVLAAQGCAITEVKEVARQVLRRGIPVNRSSTLETYIALFEGHLRQDLAAREGVVILDRFLPDYVAYALVHGNCPKDLLLLARHCHFLLAETLGYQRVFFFPIEFGLDEDGDRDPDPVYQTAISDSIRSVLDQWGQSYTHLSGSIDARIAEVLGCLPTLPRTD